MAERLCCPVDAYMLLERGGKLLMLRRAQDAAYAAGLLCPPSGHIEPGEDVMGAAIRETAEETSVRLRRDQVRCATVLHHQNPWGQARIGWFFAAGPGWTGQPVNREPAKHAELVWIDPTAPPDDLVAYTWAGIRAWQATAPYAIHFQRSGSPVHYKAGYERDLTLLNQLAPRDAALAPQAPALPAGSG
jgi:8-oxo-dGTP diphosphatase